MIDSQSHTASHPETHSLQGPPTSASVSAVTVHRQSIQSGIFEFIPIPFVDDYLIKRERRILVEKVLGRRDITYERRVPKLLADGGGKTLLGRLGGFVKSLVLKPLRKVLRSVFFWLTIRRAVLTMVETYLLARFSALPELGGQAQAVTNQEARQLGKLFAEIASQADRKIARNGSRQLWNWMKERREKSGEELPAEEVGRELEKQAPGILSEFDERAVAGLRALYPG